MTTTAKTPAAPTARPLSPHLTIYKQRLTGGLSIFHRITGVGLSFGLPLVVLWLLVLCASPDVYAQFTDLFNNMIGQLVLIGFSFAFFYHFCCGIRHLFWDAGYFLDIKAVYTTGYIAIAAALLLTAFLWLKVYGVLP